MLLHKCILTSGGNWAGSASARNTKLEIARVLCDTGNITHSALLPLGNKHVMLIIETTTNSCSWWHSDGIHQRRMLSLIPPQRQFSGKRQMSLQWVDEVVTARHVA